MEVTDLQLRLADEIPGLSRYARTLVRDPQLAEDIVQDTMVRALQGADSFREESTLSTWLHRILHNCAVDELRRRREDPSDDLEREVEAKWRDDDYTVDANAVLERAEIREELLDALVRLPVIYRAAVVLHDMEGLTVRSIAEVQGIGLPAAKQRLRRGRMMVVSALAHGHERTLARAGVPLPCWDARGKVSDFLDDELEPRDRQLVVRHLESCPTCPPLYAGLVGVRAAISTLRDPDAVVDADLADRIQELLA